MMQPLLSVRDLRVTFDSPRGEKKAVDGVSFDLQAGQALGIVGESGSGKSVTAFSLLQLIEGARCFGEAWYGSCNLLNADEAAIRCVRGKEMAMVFQEPMTALNPVMRVGEQIAECFRLHRGESRQKSYEAAQVMLDNVELPQRCMQAYPHELSGGMRQRVVLAMALACNPKILIADEPTTALDVSVQVQILDLIKRLRAEHNMALILISHDFSVVADVCDSVLVMYAGKVVEQGSIQQIFERPNHPYTKAILELSQRQTNTNSKGDIRFNVMPAQLWERA